jgi:DNA repair protein RadC
VARAREDGATFATAPDPDDRTGQQVGHRDRMRQRLLAGRTDGFHDYELLEYVLGLAIPRQDTKPLAKRLLAEFGDLPTLLAAGPAELTRVEGLGPGAAAALKFVEACAIRMTQRQAQARAVLGGMDAVVDYCHARLAGRLTEEFRVLFLNNRNMLIRDESFGEGTVNQAPAYPREIVKRALELGAASVILVHNHPSGDPTPSRDDAQLTRQIVDAARPLGIAVHDHLVIARTGHRSLRAEGLI